MVTLNRLAKAGEIYNVTSQEYITNNVEKKDTKISLTSYSSEKLGKQYRFTFAEGIEKDGGEAAPAGSAGSRKCTDDRSERKG